MTTSLDKKTVNFPIIPLATISDDQPSVRISNFFQEQELNLNQSDIPNQFTIKLPSNDNETYKPIKKPLKKVSSFHKYSNSADPTPNILGQTTYLKDALGNLQRPTSQFYPGSREVSRNGSPTLNSAAQGFYKKQGEGLLTQSSDFSGLQRTSLYSSFVPPDVSKVSYRKETWKAMRSNTMNTDTTVNYSLNSEDANRIKYIKTSKVIEKIPQRVPRGISLSKDQSKKNSFLSTLGSPDRTYNNSPSAFSDRIDTRGRTQKITMLDVVQDRAADVARKGLQTATANASRPGQIRILSILNSAQLARSNSCRTSVAGERTSLTKERNIFANDDEGDDSVITSFTNRVNSLSRQETATAPSDPNRKRDFRVVRSYETNFALARIEKVALKDLRARKPKPKEIVVKERPNIEELANSPAHFRTTTVANPVFSNHDEKAAKQAKAVKTMNQEKVFGATIRKRLIRVLTRMKELKLTPKDLYKYGKIFSSVPYERPGSKKLLAAVKAGDYSAVEEILHLQSKFLVYDFDHVHQTALHWTARKGYTEIALLLIKKGADVNAKDIAGRTPLFFALKHKHIGVLKAILANRADPWSTPECNYTELAMENRACKFYLTKARQLHIIIKMADPSLRDAMWEREGTRLMINMRYGMDGEE